MIRIVVPLSFVALAACGSSPKPKETPPPAPEEDGRELMNLPEDMSWNQPIGVPECDDYLQRMLRCRTELPVEARGALDRGLKSVVEAWAEVKGNTELGPTCAEATAATAQALGSVCPGAWTN